MDVCAHARVLGCIYSTCCLYVCAKCLCFCVCAAVGMCGCTRSIFSVSVCACVSLLLHQAAGFLSACICCIRYLCGVTVHHTVCDALDSSIVLLHWVFMQPYLHLCSRVTFCFSVSVLYSSWMLQGVLAASSIWDLMGLTPPKHLTQCWAGCWN